MTRFVSYAEFQQEILEQEGIGVVIRTDFKYNFQVPDKAPSYREAYPKRLSDKLRANALSRRISTLLPGLGFHIALGNGDRLPSNTMSLAKVRDTYSRQRLVTRLPYPRPEFKELTDVSNPSHSGCISRW